MGHLFELTMRQLARGEADFIGYTLPSKDKSEQVWLDYNFSSLFEYGLTNRRTQRSESSKFISNNSTDGHVLTDVGMRFKNSLLAYADFPTRLEELWNVKFDD